MRLVCHTPQSCLQQAHRLCICCSACSAAGGRCGRWHRLLHPGHCADGARKQRDSDRPESPPAGQGSQEGGPAGHHSSAGALTAGCAAAWMHTSHGCCTCLRLMLMQRELALHTVWQALTALLQSAATRCPPLHQLLSLSKTTPANTHTWPYHGWLNTHRPSRITCLSPHKPQVTSLPAACCAG